VLVGYGVFVGCTVLVAGTLVLVGVADGGTGVLVATDVLVGMGVLVYGVYVG
jgi:hypothetical protein